MRTKERIKLFDLFSSEFHLRSVRSFPFFFLFLSRLISKTDYPDRFSMPFSDPADPTLKPLSFFPETDGGFGILNLTTQSIARRG